MTDLEKKKEMEKNAESKKKGGFTPSREAFSRTKHIKKDTCVPCISLEEKANQNRCGDALFSSTGSFKTTFFINHFEMENSS